MKKANIIPLLIFGLIVSNSSTAASYFENIVKAIVKIDQAQKSKDSNSDPAQSTKPDGEASVKPYWELDYNKPYWYIGHIKSNNPTDLRIEEVETHIESINTANPFKKEELAKIKDVFIGDEFILQGALRNAASGKIIYNNEPSGCWTLVDYHKLSIDSLYSTKIGCYTNIFGKQRGVEIKGVRIPPFEGLTYTVYSAMVGGVDVSDVNIEKALMDRHGPPEMINFFDYRKPVDACKASLYGKYYNFAKSPVDDKKINSCLANLKSMRNAGGFFSAISMLISNGIEKTMRFRNGDVVFELSIYAKTHKEVGTFLEQLMAENPSQSLTVYTDQSLLTYTKTRDSVTNFAITQGKNKSKQNENDF